MDNWIGKSVGTVFYNTLFKETWIGIIRRGRKRKQLLDGFKEKKNTLSSNKGTPNGTFGDLASEEAVDMSQYGLQNKGTPNGTFGDLASEEAMDMSQCRLQNE